VKVIQLHVIYLFLNFISLATTLDYLKIREINREKYREENTRGGGCAVPGTTLHCYNGAVRKVCIPEGSQAVPASPSAKGITD
jgi:hypothetical protein